ncbi:MAG: DUF5009 domain-containing protein [Planctomycetes bacterium]|nr:DUF5009 domain-containing protein [Planctomycetota bacterium]
MPDTPSYGSGTPSEPRAPRALALDALRGIAILLMCLSGLLHDREHPLPPWMFHAQVPPGIGYLGADSRPGISWVDLVFPMFLFAMGAAFPLALRPRLERGVTPLRIAAGTLARGLSLALFAVYVEQMTPWRLATGFADRAEASGAVRAHLAALVAFGLLFPVYCRLPRTVAAWRRAVVRIAGIAGASAWLYTLRVPADEWWTLRSLHTVVRHRDIIILVLANMAVFGALVWLVTRDRPAWRYGAMAIWFALLACYRADAPAVGPTGGPALDPDGVRMLAGSWLRELLTIPATLRVGSSGETIPLNFCYEFDWTKYLFVVLPGTLVGDRLLAWMREREGRVTTPVWSGVRLGALAVAALATVAALTAALYGWRDPRTMAMSGRVPLLAVVAFAGLGALVRRPRAPHERFVATLVALAGFWLALGLLFEPVHGGIRKDPSYFAYYFVTTALSMLTLVALTIVVDVHGHQSALGWVIRSGQNPMVAYAGIRNLLGPLRELPLFFWAERTRSLGALANAAITMSWLRFVWGAIQTTLLAFVTAWTTRRRWLWRT